MKKFELHCIINIALTTFMKQALYCYIKIYEED